MSVEKEISEIVEVKSRLEEIMRETSSPAVVMSLQQAIYYCHLAKDFLGDDGLSPELDAIYKGEHE
jgi:hypothetical protein